MIRSGRKPDRNPEWSAFSNSVYKVAHQPSALELVHAERNAHVEPVPADDAVREDFPLSNTSLRGQVLQPRQLVAEIVDADAVHAGIESCDGQTVDQDPICETRDSGVAQFKVGQ